jgi:hypothetical protein
VNTVNFKPDVIAMLEIYNHKAVKIDTHVKLKIKFNSREESGAFTVPLSELNSFDWVRYDFRCELPTVNQSKAKLTIANQIRSKLSKVKTEKLYKIDRVGLHLIEDELFFCTGGGVVRPLCIKDESPTIEVGDIPYKLDIDHSITREESIDKMLELVSLAPNVGRVTLSYVLMWFMKKIYEFVWGKAPRSCPFVYGVSGTFKSTFTQFLVQVYNREKGIISPMRLNTSIPCAVRHIYSKNDCVEVLDDLFPADDPKLRKEQEFTLSEITRIIGDGTPPGRLSGNDVFLEPVSVGVIFTGEYLSFGNSISTAARMLAVEMTVPNAVKLREFQNNPLIVSTFYFYFIEFLVNNYQRISEHLKAWCEFYRSIDLGIHLRLQETHGFFSSAYSVFLQFCFESGVISMEEVNDFQQSFEVLLTDLVQEQNKRVCPDKIKTTASTNHFANIRSMYKNGEFNLSPNPKQFTENQDGFIYDDCLCLYGKRFNQIICKNVLGVNSKEVWDSVVAQNALWYSKDGKRSTQINGTKGKRFYKIPLVKLE